jgi:carbamoylphosphate synthase small subunit
VTQVRSLLSSYRKPVFGICLGHQILALAAGGDTYKLPPRRKPAGAGSAHPALLHHQPEPR